MEETKREELIISVRSLTKFYGSLAAVNGVSFDVKKGEIFGILGPNGAGKSTTLEIIETLRQKSGGSVQVCGYDLDTHPSEIKKRIGVQLQSSGFYPGLNLLELIRMFAGLYDVSVDPMQLLGMVQLEDKGRAKAKELSGGQRQRFSIALTLINRPELIFLDEPTTGLDPQARRNLWNLIKDIRKEGTTVILTTHYMDEAEQLCDRIAIMDEGRIVELDSPEKMIDRLIESGFQKKAVQKQANLEDVFLHLTGKEIRED